MEYLTTDDMIDYRIEPNLAPEEFLEVLTRSTLAERRPVDDPARIRAMLAGASIIVTARDSGKLIGVVHLRRGILYLPVGPRGG